MKKNIFLLLLAFAVYGNVNAQKKSDLSKAERNALLKELKSLSKNPERLQVYNKTLEVANANEVLKKVELEQATEDRNKINTRLKELNDEVVALEASHEKNAVKLQTATPSKASYKVQIGAYNNLYLSNMPSQKAFKIETNNNGTKRYLIGNFGSLTEARRFAQRLKRRGAEAFVVGYLDGTRLETLKNMPTEFQK